MNHTEISGPKGGPGGEHLTDMELLRQLDHGTSPAGAHDSRSHLEGCVECAGALVDLERDSALVTEWLGRAAFEAALEQAGASTGASTGGRPATGTGDRHRTTSRLMTPWLRAAAILVLIAAPVAALPGVRGWVMDRVGGVATVEVDPAAGPAVTAREPAVLRFVPAPGEFVVRFEPGSRGVLTLDRAAGEEAVLRSTGGEPDATVSASLLRIRNPDPGQYTLRLPDATTGVWVMIGERAVAVTDRQLDQRAVVELDG